MRLRPLTDGKPKALIEVKGRPIAEYQIDWLVKEGVNAVTFACGYKWERLKEHFGSGYNGIPIEYSPEEEPLGTGGAIKQAASLHQPEEMVIVANGDIITDLPLGRMIEAHRQAGEITASTKRQHSLTFGSMVEFTSSTRERRGDISPTRAT